MIPKKFAKGVSRAKNVCYNMRQMNKTMLNNLCWWWRCGFDFAAGLLA